MPRVGLCTLCLSRLARAATPPPPRLFCDLCESPPLQQAIVEPGFFRTPILANLRQRVLKAWTEDHPEVLAAYGDDYLAAVLAQCDRVVEKAGDPRVVVDGLYEAVAAEVPRTRTVLGTDAKINRLLAHLPAVVTDWLVRARYAMPTPVGLQAAAEGTLPSS